MVGWAESSGGSLVRSSMNLKVITCDLLPCLARKSPHHGGLEYSYQMPIFAQVLMMLDMWSPLSQAKEKAPKGVGRP